MGGKGSAGIRSLFVLPGFVSLMSGPERIASVLNRFARNGLDTMGGDDGEEMDRLLHEYFNCGEHEQEDLPGSKYS